MTTIDSSTHKFLAAVASAVQYGQLKDSAAFEVVAEGIAAQVGGEEGAKALMQSVPDEWRKDPSGYGTQRQAQAFLEGVAPVFKVDVSEAAQLAKAHLVRGKDADIMIAMNRADAAAKASSPALDQRVDFSSVAPGELRKLVDAAFADPIANQVMGLPARDSRFQDVGRELAAALHYARAPQGEEPEVRAGGVPVSGPKVREAWEKMPFGIFFSAPDGSKVGNIALNVAQLVLVRQGLGEIREEISGSPLVCGRGVPQDAFPLYVHDDGKQVGIGLGIDVAKLRAYEASNFDDATIVKRVGALLRAAYTLSNALFVQNVPLALAASPDRVAESPLLRGMLEKAGIKI